MYRSEIASHSASSTSRDRAIEEATRKANVFLFETPIEEMLHYNIQTIHEPGVNGEDGCPEYYTHIISFVFRRKSETR